MGLSFLVPKGSDGISVTTRWGETAASGGLVSYSAGPVDGYRQLGLYVGRILKGEKAGDLPVIRADKLSLALNLKTAKALGLTIPLSILARADEVIE
jgi:putative ABC transport system substrate-binding protein